MKQWYESLFENYGKKYDNENFTQGTIGECDFIEKEIDFNKSQKIIDIGCGTGRHSIELAKRGYKVTGIDLSESQLARAKEKAKAQNLQIDFQKHDARNLTFKNEYDLAIILCEGAFSLMETDEMNYEILRNATNSLKTAGKLIFTTLNGLFPLFHSVEEFGASTTEEGNATYSKNTFDLMTFRDFNHSNLKRLIFMEQNSEPFQEMINLKQKILRCWSLLKSNGSLRASPHFHLRYRFR
jgi:2-polyprenyl-3-methyl-5-hydroxy-6-metoxy-1,4-benzoquinol methylase